MAFHNTLLSATIVMQLQLHSSSLCLRKGWLYVLTFSTFGSCRNNYNLNKRKNFLHLWLEPELFSKTLSSMQLNMKLPLSLNNWLFEEHQHTCIYSTCQCAFGPENWTMQQHTNVNSWSATHTLKRTSKQSANGSGVPSTLFQIYWCYQQCTPALCTRNLQYSSNKKMLQAFKIPILCTIQASWLF